ncbi:MAG TPA: hypothetical protein VNH11_06305 [Pirellulales bacterium]|nr:hypothetical protein [Pirellulales bacterium]
MPKRINQQQRDAVLQMRAEGHDRDSIAAAGIRISSPSPREEDADVDGRGDGSRTYNRDEHNRGRLCYGGAGVRFPFLPARLRDLADLACGASVDDEANVPLLFEERCADAFRSLGFVVKELGQGCGRSAAAGHWPRPTDLGWPLVAGPRAGA